MRYHSRGADTIIEACLGWLAGILGREACWRLTVRDPYAAPALMFGEMMKHVCLCLSGLRVGGNMLVCA